MNNKYLKNWLALLRQTEVGAATFHQYLAQDPMLATLPEFVQPNWQAVERDLEWGAHPNQHIVTFNNPAYPNILRQIARPPAILFVKGNLSILNRPQIAIIGSRNPTQIGLDLSFDFGATLAKAGLIITSGLALGIDGASHRGALTAAGLTTVAVLGHGLDIIYPRQHTNLAQTIIERGALVSEFPTGVQPVAGNFPQRNRIISGLSLGVVVIEAAVRSGSLITAKLALEQGREVFALPGSAINQKARGCNELIQQGAKLVLSPKDVVAELGPLFNYVFSNSDAGTPSNEPLLGNEFSRSGDQRSAQLLTHIGSEPTSIDHIVASSGFSVTEISGMLLHLELLGDIAAVPGGYTIRTGLM